MELQQLRYVTALARTESFSEAAKQVNVSQPALSQQVKKLEQELDRDLFERTSGGVKPTSRGKGFVDHAYDILETVRQAKNSVRNDTDLPPDGTLKIGVIPTIAPYLLPSVIPEMSGWAPELSIQVDEQLTDDLIEQLRQGQIDLAVLSLPFPEDGLSIDNLGEEPFYLAVGENQPLSDRDKIDIADVDDMPFLLLEEGHCLRDQSLSFCEAENVHPGVVFQGSSLYTILNLVQADFGYSFVPDMVRRSTEKTDMLFVPFKSPEPYREIVVARRQNSPDRPAVTRFIEKASSYVSSNL